MAVLDPVVLGLGPVRVARHAAGLLQRFEPEPAPGEQLVDVRLMPGVPQDDVTRGVEDPVQRQRQLDGAEIGAQMATGRGDRLDDEGPDLFGQDHQFFLAEVLDV